MTIQRLGPGDEAILTVLATEDADFDLDGRGEPLVPLSPAAARDFLANPAVLVWVARDDDRVIGFLYCVVVPLRSGAGRELLLYEIGVRSADRRHGTGRALLDHMEAWMRAHGFAEVWVLADNPDAVAFYRGCSFAADADDQPTYMTRELA